MNSPYWSLEQLTEKLHEQFNRKFEGRTIPSESVTEPFISRVVQSILEEFETRGSIPFVPDFRVMNQSTLNDQFNGAIPDFSKHVNLVGLGKDNPPSQPGVMNVAIDGDDARRYEKNVRNAPGSDAGSSSPQPGKSPPSSTPKEETGAGPPTDLSPEDARKRLRLIRGGKSINS